MSRKKLMAIGGAEDREGDCTILREFVRLAGGEEAHIVLLTVATNDVKETAAEYRKVFRKLQARGMNALDVSIREDTDSPKLIKFIEAATGIFFSGGDQLNITALMGGTKMAALIKDKYDRGTIVAGTSAGAAMMANSMLLSGNAETNPRFGAVEIGPGMDFLPDTIIDTHFSQRGRYGRLMTAVAHYPQDIGLGIDEDTAMLIRDDEFTVLGAGAVSVIDAGSCTHTNITDVAHGESLELHNLSVHIVPAGARYDLSKRQPVVKQGRTRKKG